MKNYTLKLKGYVGGWDFDSDYVDYILDQNAAADVDVLIDSLGGSLGAALTISAAFKNHGKVHVHYTGMNASAATIASLGAKHISIDAHAMYLVHRVGYTIDAYERMDAERLDQFIKEWQQHSADLKKMDEVVAAMYAARCKREPERLLDLMSKGGWLTAQEALAWGFVDEITEDDPAATAVVTPLVAEAMAAAGIPALPDNLVPRPDRQQNFIDRIVAAIQKILHPAATIDTNSVKEPATPASMESHPAADEPAAPVVEEPAEADNEAVPEAIVPEVVVNRTANSGAATDCDFFAVSNRAAELLKQI